jgi:protein O-mannosyl-transferase
MDLRRLSASGMQSNDPYLKRSKVAAALPSGAARAKVAAPVMASSKPLQPLPPLPATSSETSASGKLIPLLLLGLMLGALWPLLIGDFTIWDDNRAVVINPWLNPPTLHNMAQFWNPRHPHMDIWIPLTYTIWSAVAAVSYVPTADPETGAHLNPWIFHGANLLVHAVSVLVVYAILKRAAGKSWPAAAGAALYAIHPVQVEPVGWICGMKDVLAGCLGLIAVWQYLLFASGDKLNSNQSVIEPAAEQSQWATAPLDRNQPIPVREPLLHYMLASLAFVLAMLAKPSGIVIPLVVGALDLFLLRRRLRSVVLWLLPWLLLTIPIIIEGRRVQPAPSTEHVAIALRPLIAADALAFYMYKLAFPLKLAIVYDRTPQAALAHHWPYYTWLAPAAVVIFLWLFRRRFPWLIACVGVFWLAVLPVLGLVPFDFQSQSTVADHYLYLAMLGPALALAMALKNAQGRKVAAIVFALLLLLAGRAFVQAWTWRDAFSLFGNAVAVNPHGCGPYLNLADAYRTKRDYPTSIATYEQGLKYNADCAPLRIGYASTLATIGNSAEARRQYEIAAQTATGGYLTMIRQAVVKLNQESVPATQKSHYLTPDTSPIK